MKIQIITLSAVLMFGNLLAQTISNYTTTDGLLNDNVLCVAIDGTNTLWFGTQMGVSVFDGMNWSSHTTTTDPGLVDNNIQAIYCAANGDVWVGTDFGASVFNGTSWTTYTSVDGLGNDVVKCVSEDQDGHIWFGTNNGASEFDGASWVSYGSAQGIPFGGVNSITLHSNGDLWMGTGLSGILIFDGSSFTGVSSTDGLIDDRVRAIAIDAQNNKWVGTSQGVSVFDNSDTFAANHTTMFTLPAPDTLNPIEDVKIDGGGNIWVGVYVDYLVTEGGVCAYNGNQWVEYHVADGLVGPVVRGLAIDSNDDVWVATSTGVSKIHDPTVALQSHSEFVPFELYPNPAAGVVHVTLMDRVIEKEQHVVVYDASMQLVAEQSVASDQNKVTFALEDLNSGVYFVRCGAQIKKLIIYK